MIEELTVTVTRTADGLFDYVQIASPAAMPVNIVLIAGRITVQDDRVVREIDIRRKSKKK